MAHEVMFDQGFEVGEGPSLVGIGRTELQAEGMLIQRQ